MDALFDEVENLRLQLYEAEMRCALLEAETREEVMREMEERMRKMEEMYSRRITSEVFSAPLVLDCLLTYGKYQWEQNELKTDAKIDMLHRSGLFGSPEKASRRPVVEDDVSEAESDAETSLVRLKTVYLSTCCNVLTLVQVDYSGHEEDVSEDENEHSLSLSPLAHKTTMHSPSKSPRKSSLAPRVIIEERPFIPDPSPLPSDTEEAQESQSETENDEDDICSVAPSGTTASNLGDEDTDDNDSYADSQDDEEWEEPPYSKTPKAKSKVILSPSPSPSPKPKAGKKSVTSKARLSKLADDMDHLHIESKGADDSVVILPKRSQRRIGPSTAAISSEDDDDNDDDELLIPVKKKKRSVFSPDNIILC